MTGFLITHLVDAVNGRAVRRADPCVHHCTDSQRERMAVQCLNLSSKIPARCLSGSSCSAHDRNARKSKGRGPAARSGAPSTSCGSRASNAAGIFGGTTSVNLLGAP
jgi:hypothetical protein